MLTPYMKKLLSLVDFYMKEFGISRREAIDEVIEDLKRLKRMQKLTGN